MPDYIPSSTQSLMARKFQQAQQPQQDPNAMPAQTMQLLQEALAAQIVDKANKAAQAQLAQAAAQPQPTVAEDTRAKLADAAKSAAAGQMAQSGIAALPGAQQGQPQAPQMPPQQMAAGGLARLPTNLPKEYAGGGIVSFAGDGPEGSKVEGAPSQEDEDRASMMDTLRRMGYSAMDIATMLPRGVAGAAESVITRPLRALGVPVPYLPESFYGGDRESATPYYDKLRAGSAGAKQKADEEVKFHPDASGSINSVVAGVANLREPDRTAALNQLIRQFGEQAVSTALAGVSSPAVQGPARETAYQGAPAQPPSGLSQLAAAQPQPQEARSPLADVLEKRLTEGLTLDREGEAQRLAREQNDALSPSQQAAIAAQKEGIAALRALQEKEQASRPGMVLGMFNPHALAAINPRARNIGEGLAPAMAAVEKARVGQSETDIAYQTKINALNTAMQNALQENDIGKVNRLQDIRKGLDANYRAELQGAVAEVTRGEATEARRQRDREIAAGKPSPVEAEQLKRETGAANELARSPEADILKKDADNIMNRNRRPEIMAQLRDLENRIYKKWGLPPPHAEGAGTSTMAADRKSQFTVQR